MKLILASESPGRKQALLDAGYVFEVIPSNYEEDMTMKLTPTELVKVLSQGKARSVAALHPNAIIIGADTIALFEGVVMGKPHTEENSIKMLQMLSGKTHSMVTGLTVINTATGKEIAISVETKVRFRKLPQEEIEEYTRMGEALKKAGAYAYQLNGYKFVENTEGSISNISGLPMEKLKEVLGEIM